MKIILSEIQLKKLIKEDLGVSRPAISYSNLILKKLTPITLFFAQQKRGFKKNIVLTTKEISEIYQNSVDDFIELPIEKIVINLTCKKVKPNTYEIPFSTSGAAYPLEKKYKKSSYMTEPSLSLPKYILEQVTETMVAKIDIEVETSPDFTSELEDNLIYDLRDTIVHEMNHVLEYYKRYESGTSSMNVSLSWSGQKNYNIPQNIFELWKNFLDLVYYSEPYEINARTQEAFSQIIRTNFEDYKNSKIWKTTIEMKEFDADKLYNELVEKFEGWKKGSSSYGTESLFKWFKRDFEENMRYNKLELPRFIDRSNNLRSLLNKFEPKIKNAGETQQRKIMRLFAIETDN